MRRDRFAAMGTEISVLLPNAYADAGFQQVRSLFAEWEQVLSRFREDSELSHVNRHAEMPVIVTPLFLRVLTAALDAARATDGVYDPTLLNQLVGVGYDRTFAEVPPDWPALSYRPVPGGGWRRIKGGTAHRVVTLPAGVALDFGGIAKGMAVDAALEGLVALGTPRAAVEAGGDLRVHGLLPGESSWEVAVDLKEGQEVVSLFRGALATSTVGRRRWTRGGRTYHHLLDPRSGEPSTSPLWSVSVVAARCAQADVAAKVALILGPCEGARFLERHHLAGLLVTHDGQLRRVGPWLEGHEEPAS
jgi:thiamine biosynthesis lipoprotein